MRIPRPAAIAVFVAGYSASVALGEHAYGTLAVPSPFWLPDAVLLSAMLLNPGDQRWFFLAAMVPIRLILGAVPGTPMWFQLITIGNDALKAAGAGWLLERFAGHRLRFETLNEFLLFLGIAAMAVPLLSALAVAPALYIRGASVWQASYQWFLGDALAQVVVTPAILYWTVRGRGSSGRVPELLVLCAGLTVALYYAFVVSDRTHALILLYVPVPFLVWAAVRLRPFGTTMAISLIAIVSMVGAVRGTGVFGIGASPHAVLSLQLFLLVTAVPSLSLAILTTERETLREREAGFNTRLLEAQDIERARIAQELHDDVGQRMALLQISLEQFRLAARLSPAERDQLDVCTAISAQIASDMHTLSHRLHPSTLDIVGLETAMKGLCRDFVEQHHIDVACTCQDVPEHVEREVSICLFRIAQEALHNVVKHSGATAAEVELRRRGSRLTLSVSDRGCGFDADLLGERTGLGLVSMRERLRPLGGHLTIQSSARGGTRISVDVPASPQAASLPLAAGA